MAAGPWAERRRGWPAVHERKGGDDYYLELPWYVAGAIARVATRRRRRRPGGTGMYRGVQYYRYGCTGSTIYRYCTVLEYSCTAVFIYSLCVYYYTGVPYRYLASRYR
jgi:hypothetical protein